MKFIGIDIASETHVVAVVNDQGDVVLKATAFKEDASGYKKLLELLGEPKDSLVAMEATGHYWKNLFAVLSANGFAVALLNPLRTHRFSGEDLQRTKTDAIDALAIARFAAQKRPVVTRMPEPATEELRELVRLRDRMVQDFGDRVRQLHRLVDLGFPEFTRFVKGLDTSLATTLLHDFPTAHAFVGASPKAVGRMRYDGKRTVGEELAARLIAAAETSVGQHHGEVYRVQVRYMCEDIDVLRRRIKDLEGDIEKKLEDSEVGQLLTTIEGIGPQTAARIIAKLDLASFVSGAAVSAFVGVVPGLRMSGTAKGNRAALSPIGDAALRTALWMPTLTAVRFNPWLKAHYQRLRARGKLHKVALTACMRKLLHAIYSVAKNRRPFVPRLPAEQVTG